MRTEHCWNVGDSSKSGKQPVPVAIRPANVWVFGYAGEYRQRWKNLTSMSSAHATYLVDPQFKYCLRDFP